MKSFIILFIQRVLGIIFMKRHSKQRWRGGLIVQRYCKCKSPKFISFSGGLVLPTRCKRCGLQKRPLLFR